MAAFAQFGSDLDASTQKLLNRGARLTELLKQAQFSPLGFEEQTCVIFAGTNGYLDDIPVSDVKRFEKDLLDFMRSRYGTLLDEIRSSGDLPGGVEAAIKAFKLEFVPSETAAAAGTTEA
jgi:F-type H+-transporting ATPase subunit alpha